MPPRLNHENVRNLFTQAGFIPDNEFNYRNTKSKYRVFDILNNRYVRISVQTLRYNIKTGKRPLWEEPTMLANDDPVYRDGIERFGGIKRKMLGCNRQLVAGYNRFGTGNQPQQGKENQRYLLAC